MAAAAAAKKVNQCRTLLLPTIPAQHPPAAARCSSHSPVQRKVAGCRARHRHRSQPWNQAPQVLPAAAAAGGGSGSRAWAGGAASRQATFRQYCQCRPQPGRVLDAVSKRVCSAGGRLGQRHCSEAGIGSEQGVFKPMSDAERPGELLAKPCQRGPPPMPKLLACKRLMLLIGSTINSSSLQIERWKHPRQLQPCRARRRASRRLPGCRT